MRDGHGGKKIFIMETWRVEKGFWTSPFLAERALAEYCVKGLEQACDTAMPDIIIKRSFRRFVEDEIPGLVKGTQAFVAHPGTETPCPRKVDGPVSIVVGPEGGLIPFEIGLLKSNGFEPVSVGDRILRVEHFVPTILGRLF